MSNQQTIYIGAYLEVHMNLQDEVFTTKECPVHGRVDVSTKFCPQCGAKIDDIFRSETTYANYYNEICDNDALMEVFIYNREKGNIILLSNYSQDNTHMNIKSGFDGELDIIDKDVCVLEFRHKFKNEIQKLLDSEYVKGVYFKYGLVAYWN